MSSGLGRRRRFRCAIQKRVFRSRRARKQSQAVLLHKLNKIAIKLPDLLSRIEAVHENLLPAR
jgi:hypothetical protein